MAEYIFPTKTSPIPGSTVQIVAGGYREEVIRCRDCLHSEKDDGMIFCRMASTGQWRHAPVRPDGFCAWGERGE